MNIMQSSSQKRSAEKKAVIGGGWITSPGVVAHMRRHLVEMERRTLQRVAQQKALIGGGWITSPAVAAHMRQTMPAKNRR